MIVFVVSDIDKSSTGILGMMARIVPTWIVGVFQIFGETKTKLIRQEGIVERRRMLEAE